MKLILASSSPRRAEILHDAGISFSVLSSAVDESAVPGETPQQHVQRLADAKGELVAARAVGPAIILAADTVVVLDGQILGKPRSTDEGRRMLELFSGRTHSVITGVTLLRLAPHRWSGGQRDPGMAVDVSWAATLIVANPWTEYRSRGGGRPISWCVRRSSDCWSGRRTC